MHRGDLLRPLADPDLPPPIALPLPSRPPVFRNAFVGRDAQLRETVRRLSLPDGRVVTLVGRSGVGKTRLATEVARRLGGGYAGGAVFVDFSQHTGRSLASRVSTALGLRVPSDQPVADAVRRHLRFSPALIVADDVDAEEGALDGLVELAADAPQTRILATAQRPTGHAEEHVVRLRPLPVPAVDADAEAIRRSPAVSLYLARVAAADPDRPPAEADIPLIAELCRRLDGLPLAIELGAARARLLSPAGQLRALDGGDALDLRAARGDRRPPRHQDLRSSIETTWAMTEPDERCVLRRMAVFAGPPTLEHLVAVVGDESLPPAAILDALATLVDLGLVEPEPGGETRYHLLPTIRTFAIEQLAASGEAEALGHRHADAWVEVARRSRGLMETAAAATLAREADDLAVALSFLDSRHRIADALELASDLVSMWTRVGVPDIARATHARLLAAAQATDAHIPAAVGARGLVAATVLAVAAPSVGHMQATVAEWIPRAVALARESGDDETLLHALEWAAVAVVMTGDLAGAIAANAEGLALARAHDWVIPLARFEYRQSMFAAQMGDVATAAAVGGTALRRARANGDPESIVRTGMHLAWFPRDIPGMPADLPSLEELLRLARASGCLFEEAVLYPQLAFRQLVAGDVPGAARWCAEGLRFATRIGTWQGVTLSLVALMLAEGAVADDVAVARIFGRVSPELAVVERSIGIADARVLLAAVVDGARARLGEEGFAREAASTAHLDRDAVIDWASGYARGLAAMDGAHSAAPAAQPAPSAPTPPAPAAAPPPGGRPSLTPRERQVLVELARGRTNREIGAALGLTEKTVMHHSVSIYAKLGVRGRAEATAWAVRNGVVDESRRH